MRERRALRRRSGQLLPSFLLLEARSHVQVHDVPFERPKNKAAYKAKVEPLGLTW